MRKAIMTISNVHMKSRFLGDELNCMSSYEPVGLNKF